MRRSAGALVVAALLVGCGGGSAKDEAGNLVEMGADGFSPATLTVKVGDTVTFSNGSGEDKWPASDEHPTHELYPGFDAGRSVLNGDSYDFTFERRGTWGYHDHLNPELRGTIVVE